MFYGVRRRVKSNAVTLLLRESDRLIGLFDRVAGCFMDYRDRRYTEHSVRTLVAQRIAGIALGYDDLSDHDDQRHDLDALRAELVELFIDSTDDEVHGSQEGRFFHWYYGHYCFFAAVLLAQQRPGNATHGWSGGSAGNRLRRRPKRSGSAGPHGGTRSSSTPEGRVGRAGVA